MPSFNLTQDIHSLTDRDTARHPILTRILFTVCDQQVLVLHIRRASRDVLS
ncbi:MAG: hypothetical protein WC314_23430 [Vulcanimicrobiota bacterium]